MFRIPREIISQFNETVVNNKSLRYMEKKKIVFDSEQ